MPDEEIAYAHEFTVTGQTAKRMAQAAVLYSLTTIQMRVCVVLVPVFVSLLLYLTSDGYGVSQETRVLESVVRGIVIAAPFLVVLKYVGFVRKNRRVLPPGDILRSGFGHDEFVMATPLSSIRHSYRAVGGVASYGSIVFIRLRGSPLASMWPKELVPPEAMARLLRAGAQR